MHPAQALRLATRLSIACFYSQVAGHQRVTVNREVLEDLIKFVRDTFDVLVDDKPIDEPFFASGVNGAPLGGNGNGKPQLPSSRNAGGVNRISGLDEPPNSYPWES